MTYLHKKTVKTVANCQGSCRLQRQLQYVKSGKYILKYTLTPLLSQGMVHLALTKKSVCIDIVKHTGVKNKR